MCNLTRESGEESDAGTQEGCRDGLPSSVIDILQTSNFSFVCAQVSLKWGH